MLDAVLCRFAIFEVAIGLKNAVGEIVTDVSALLRNQLNEREDEGEKAGSVGARRREIRGELNLGEAKLTEPTMIANVSVRLKRDDRMRCECKPVPSGRCGERQESDEARR